jgi:hypothetical protein
MPFNCICKSSSVKENEEFKNKNIQSNDVVAPVVASDKPNMYIMDNDDNEIKSLVGLCNEIYGLKEKIGSVGEKGNISAELKNLDLDVPKILLLGTQTSGKSSVLNNIIGYDILPTGENMVTRTPLNVFMRNGANESVLLYYIENGKKICYYNEKFQNFNKDILRRKIMEITDLLTGGSFLISHSTIYIEITKRNFIDLTIVDLPGLVTIACTDKGQSETIVDDLQSLYESQLSSNNVFVVVIIQAKTDLETDYGLSTVKKLCSKYKGVKTMGILTKPDLLDKKNLPKFDTIFSNEISQNVSLDHGYYVLNNQLPDEYQQRDVQYLWYHKYFGKRSKVIDTRRYGIVNITEALQKHINNFLLSKTNSLRRGLEDAKSVIVKNIQLTGTNINDSKSRLLFVINNAFNLSKELSDSINSVGNNNNIGNKIKAILESYENELGVYDPFSKTNLPDSKLKSITNSFEGFAQNTKNINLIIHKCFSDNDIAPFTEIFKYYNKAMNSLNELFLADIDFLLNLEHINSQTHFSPVQLSNFPKIKEFLREQNAKILNKYKDKSLRTIQEYLDMLLVQKMWYSENDVIEMESEMMNEIENYDNNEQNDDKKKILQKRRSSISILGLFDEPMYNISQTRKLISIIFRRVMESIKEVTFKTIFSSFIINYEKNFFSETLLAINEHKDADTLFFVSQEAFFESKKYDEFLKEIEKYLKYINDVEKLI